MDKQTLIFLSLSLSSCCHEYGSYVERHSKAHSVFLCPSSSSSHTHAHTMKTHMDKRGGSRAVAEEKRQSLHGRQPLILAVLAGRARNEAVERSSVLRIWFPHCVSLRVGLTWVCNTLGSHASSHYVLYVCVRSTDLGKDWTESLYCCKHQSCELIDWDFLWSQWPRVRVSQSMTPIYTCYSSWSLHNGHSAVWHIELNLYILYLTLLVFCLDLIKYFAAWFGSKGSEQTLRNPWFYRHIIYI